MAPTTKYLNQRPKKTPPHVTVKSLRNALGLKMDEVIERVREESNGSLNLTRGHISAIESGTRGASQPLLDALCVAYGLEPGAIVTDFEPRSREVSRGDAA